MTNTNTNNNEKLIQAGYSKVYGFLWSENPVKVTEIKFADTHKTHPGEKGWKVSYNVAINRKQEDGSYKSEFASVTAFAVSEKQLVQMTTALTVKKKAVPYQKGDGITMMVKPYAEGKRGFKFYTGANVFANLTRNNMINHGVSEKAADKLIAERKQAIAAHKAQAKA